MEEKQSIWSEKRVSPRVCSSGRLIFKPFHDREFHEDPYVTADLLEMSIDGMRIKTTVPLEEKNLLEFNRDYQVTQVALVKWVKKIENCYYAGLMYFHH